MKDHRQVAIITVLRGYKYEVGIKNESSFCYIKILILLESRKIARCELDKTRGSHVTNM